MHQTIGAEAPQKYFGIFDSANKVREEFSNNSYDYDTREYKYEEIPGFPTDAQILFAFYEYEDYSGSAFVLFEAEGKLFEVNGGHCSCYGLEGQWTPEETTWAALAMRPVITGEKSEWGLDVDTEYTAEGVAYLRALVKAKVA